MAENFTSIGDMMQYMRTGKPFSIEYVQFNKKTGAGGTVKRIAVALLLKGEEKESIASQIADKKTLVHHVKNPQHFFNSTINIRVMAAGNADIRKVHVQLICRINGATVK